MRKTPLLDHHHRNAEMTPWTIGKSYSSQLPLTNTQLNDTIINISLLVSFRTYLQTITLKTYDFSATQKHVRLNHVLPFANLLVVLT